MGREHATDAVSSRNASCRGEDARRRGRCRSSEAVRNLWSRAPETGMRVREEKMAAKSEGRRMRRRVVGHGGRPWVVGGIFIGRDAPAGGLAYGGRRFSAALSGSIELDQRQTQPTSQRCPHRLSAAIPDTETVAPWGRRILFPIPSTTFQKLRISSGIQWISRRRHSGVCLRGPRCRRRVRSRCLFPARQASVEDSLAIFRGYYGRRTGEIRSGGNGRR